MTEKVTIRGIPVTVISDRDAENVDFVVCMPRGPSQFSDNFTGFCSHCGIEIMYRWHAPRKPPKICFACAMKINAAEKAKRGG